MTAVFYATSRVPLGGSAPTDFGKDPNPLGALTFGRAEVPDVTQGASLDQAIALDNPSGGTLVQPLQDAIVGAAADHLLLYIHGFNFSFRQCVVQAGKLAAWYGGGTPAVPSSVIALSWPSLNSLGEYGKDFDRASASGDAFRQFLRAMVPLVAAFRQARSGSRRVSLLCHSMGNHVLRAGLQSALGDAPGQYDPTGQQPLFDRIVLAGADDDVDALSHRNKLAPAADIAERVYLYYNNQDAALFASMVIHLAGRLGINGPSDKPSFRGENYTFVNCSMVQPKDPSTGGFVDPEFHQYYRLVPQVRDDICGVISGAADDALPHRGYRQDHNFYQLLPS